MLFGNIEYLNLLPFHVFMKRFTKNSQQSMGMHYKRGVPSKINKEFMARRVDSAFISSVNARKYKNIGLGIIAKKEVQSVIVVPQDTKEIDSESATSNVLLDILDLQGKVLIGDKALRYTLHSKNYIDLAKAWNTTYNVPFVFALLCYHGDSKVYKTIEKYFLKQKVKIPQYILQKASKKTLIPSSEISAYLNFISYKYDVKAKRGLKKFYTLIDKKRLS